jgi:hypothetical protein
MNKLCPDQQKYVFSISKGFPMAKSNFDYKLLI